MRKTDRYLISRTDIAHYLRNRELEPEKYRRQIHEYAELLRQMGYERTEGYLWFVRLQRIEKVV